MEDDERFLHELLVFMEHADAQQSPADASASEVSAADGASSCDDGAHSAPRTAPERSDAVTATTTATATATASRSKTARNVTRDRLQSELRQLRAQRLELEHALAAMHAQRGSAREVQTSLSQSELLLLATWERIARRQLAQRERAEADNALLRAQVAHSLEVTRALQQSAMYWMRELAPWGATGGTGDVPSAPHIALTSTPFADPRDVAIYKALAVGLNETVQRTDSVMRETGLDSWCVGAVSSSVQIKTRDGAVYIEFLGADVFPYPQDVVFAASRNVWAQRSLAKSCAVHDALPLSREMFASKSCCEIACGGARVSLEFLSVTHARAVADADAFTYAWRGVTKSDTHFPGAVVNETGWQVVRGVDGVSGLSVVLTCTQLEPRSNGSSPSSSNNSSSSNSPSSLALDAGAALPFADFVLSALQVDMQEVNNLMMDALLLHDDDSNAAATSALDSQAQATGADSDNVLEVHV